MRSKRTLTAEEERALQISKEFAWIDETIAHLDTPSYHFDVGSKVQYGALEESIVDEVREDGKIYILRCTSRAPGDSKQPTTTYRVVPWTEVRPLCTRQTSMVQNTDLRLSFSPCTLDGILHRYYHFGVDMDPFYQRGYVWEQSDKEYLIDSIFCNIKFGELIFVQSDYKKAEQTGCLYEILDGKQRLDAIRGYYENRYPYRGFYFNDLGPKDRHAFLECTVPVANLRHADEETILRCFLMVNRAGKRMDESHLLVAENRLKELEKKKSAV